MTRSLYEFLFTQNILPEELNHTNKYKALIRLLNTHIITTHYHHKTLILTAGEIPNKVYFVEHGMARGFTYEPKNQKEKTVSLWLGKSLMTDVVGFIHHIKTNLYIEVMPDTVLASVTYDQLENVFDSFPGSRAFLNCLIENDIKYSNKRLADQSWSAWDRLVEMRRIYPKLELMVSKEMIASFLNISPQHLSKIIRLNRFKK